MVYLNGLEKYKMEERLFRQIEKKKLTDIDKAELVIKDRKIKYLKD